MLRTAPLFAGSGESFDKKKYPSARLRALGLLNSYVAKWVQSMVQTNNQFILHTQEQY